MELMREIAPTATVDIPLHAPRPPESLDDAGLSEELVGGLVLKILNGRGTATGLDLADAVALPMALVDEVLGALQEQRYIEVHRTQGPRRGEYVFKLTSAGRKRAAEELEMCRYAGPAPVPFEHFRRWVELQSVEKVSVSAPELYAALAGVVLPKDLIDLLGPAINSGRSLFLHGGPGDGKTLLAERIARLYGEEYFVPYSVLVDDSVMIVYDPVHHRADPVASGADVALCQDTSRPDAMLHHDSGEAPVTDSGAFDSSADILRDVPAHDRRFARARRPVVITGGELTLDQLDLQWDPAGRMYQAPPQLKAAGGVLVVDDLGRQRVPVRDLLNRWVVPLEQRRDYLTPRSGRKVVVPFDCFVIFSTNLEPSSLADEAFLRRIHYKIELAPPDRDEYARIFRSCCDERGIDFDEEVLEALFDELYADGAIEPRRCHPRDVLDHLGDLARYRDEPPRLSPELLGDACRSYFLPTGAAS